MTNVIESFFSFPAYVMLPLIILVLALIVGVKLKEAVLITIKLAAGFAGIFIAFGFFVGQIAPAVEQLVNVRGLDYPVPDVGWPPLAAISWSNPIAPLSIPLVLGLNIILLSIGATRTLYIDIWNYWHFAVHGVLVSTAPDVERETGIRKWDNSIYGFNG